MIIIHNDSATRFTVSFGDALFHYDHATLLRSMHKKHDYFRKQVFTVIMFFYAPTEEFTFFKKSACT